MGWTSRRIDSTPGSVRPVESDIELAERVARRAGELLVQLRSDFGPVDRSDRDRIRQLRDAADRASHELIAAELAGNRPADAVLSEEGVDGTARDTADRVWIVDPLDGTSEYGQGRTDFAVHIALWQRDQPGEAGGRLKLGVVDLPAGGLCWTSAGPAAEPAAGPAGESVRPDPGAPVRLVVSRSRPPKIVEDPERLADIFRGAGIENPGVELLNVGSVGAKVAEILAGRADLYVHDSGFFEWDVAAPLAVARHHGLAGCHLDGSEVTFNHRPTRVRDLVIGRPDLVAAILSAGSA